MKKRILFIDDEQNFLNGLQRMLHKQRGVWDMSFVCSVDAALDQLKKAGFDVIVSDVKMPGKDGFELLKILRVSETTRSIPVIIVTGCNESDLKRQSLDLGATDLLNKPVDREDLLARLHSVLRLKSYQDELKMQNTILDQKVKERTKEVEDSRLDIIWRLGKVAEFRDEETGNHVIRVGCYCRAIAEALGMGQDFVEMLFLTSPLHDIGKIGIPDNVLLKGGRLNPEEWQIMKGHCEIGANVFSQDYGIMKSFLVWREKHLQSGYETRNNGLNPLLKMASSIAMTHHERWDGKGYPKGLAREDIPIESRIAAISDVYDALCSKRPYKSTYPESKVLEIMSKNIGKHFDPNIYMAFEKSLEGFRSIRARYAD